MNDKNVTLSLADHEDLRLRAIGREDIENLRVWKNKNKSSFFLNRDIQPEEQQKWFAAFAARDEDYMFVVEQKTGNEWQSIGCLGFRRLPDEGCVDAYNIMRGENPAPASFTMSDAFAAMLAYAAWLYPDLPIRCKVLCGNPAVEWYKKSNFSIVERVNDEYYLMEFAKDSLKNRDLIVNKTK
jgi:RimJ/RimL family protein N-acetyltransferase